MNTNEERMDESYLFLNSPIPDINCTFCFGDGWFYGEILSHDSVVEGFGFQICQCVH